MLFFLECVRMQGEKALALQLSDKIEIYLSQKQLQVWKLFQEHTQLTRKQIHEMSGIPYVTVGQILSKLEKMKKVVKQGERRGVVYRIVE